MLLATEEQATMESHMNDGIVGLGFGGLSRVTLPSLSERNVFPEFSVSFFF